jgi:hypothetical protein|tara:strand:+ start:790 stop:1257 length:468 start_codon:yes stop_codon:yes gene_type:complete
MTTTPNQVPPVGEGVGEPIQLKTNHNVRIVNLGTGDHVLCIFGEVRAESEDNKVIGYRMMYPFKLTLGETNEDGTIPINYTRWCPFSPVEEHRLGGEHIISVVYPDNNILDNFVTRLKTIGLEDDQIFWNKEEGPNGNTGKPTEVEQPVADSTGE